MRGVAIAALMTPAMMGIARAADDVVAGQLTGQRISFDIPTMPLSQGLELFSEQSRLAYAVAGEANLAGTGKEVKGEFVVVDALTALLDGSDVTFSISDGVLVIFPRSTAGVSGEDTVTAPVTIMGSQMPGYGMGSGENSGSTVLDEALIDQFVQGNGDPNMLFRAMPNVQFVVAGQRGDTGATATATQDLRPQTISISGGAVDQNNIMLDGVSINSVGGTESVPNADNMPGDDDTAINADQLHGLHPQTVYVDSSILQSAEIIDSNVSSKYGGFQGGVVNYQVKDPSDVPTFSASVRQGRDNWVDYHLKSDEAPEESARPPRFEKTFYTASASTPLNDQWGMLMSLSAKRAEVTKTTSEKYYGREITNTTESDSMLGKLRYESNNGAVLRTQLTYAPHSQEWESTQSLDSKMNVTGSGMTSYVSLENPIDYEGYGFSDLSLDTKISFNNASNARDSDENIRRFIYARRSGVDSPNYATLCDGGTATSVSCLTGGFGDLEQVQRDYALNSDVNGKLFGNDLLLGGEVKRTSARRERPEDAVYYYTPDSQGNAGVGTVVCADASDVACDDGDQANTRRTLYNAFTGNVSFVTGALYSEYGMRFEDVPFGDLILRPGLRLERETYLGNTNLAPRMVATYETDWDVVFSGGWNRYYANNMLGYALQDATPATQTERRVRVDAGGNSTYYTDGANGWTASSSGIQKRFAGAGLSTPFTDERTASVAFPVPLLGGMSRLKWIRRDGKDQFARSTEDTGTTYYNLTNEGRNSYTSYSAEWSRDLGPWFGGRHLFNINAQWAERSTSNNSYYGTTEEDNDVLFNGQLISQNQLAILTGNLDEPLFFNISLYSSFDEDRLRTGLTGRYTLAYDTISDSGSNETLNGQSYDVYEEELAKARFDLDMTLDYDVIRNAAGVLTFNASIDNVLNRGGAHTLSSSTPYRAGRAFWLGLTYTY
ncbi:hypothetical protein [Thalassospira sp.]|uniref:hypothetical protein n=1 Tax=Thalassospira sp. TaxID=1912094 RepID=UPI002732A2BF|nr:hypothetical protein [Thalassospira sp.]MDP2698379.1 hypothetical protein [Thalassospira sp.]